MGVDRSDYVIVGYKMPYNLKVNGEQIEWYDDKYLRFVEGWQDEPFRLVVDGMSGEYAVFGEVLTYSTENDGGVEFTEIDVAAIDFTKVKAKFMELFGEFLPPDFPIHPKVLAFTHWS